MSDYVRTIQKGVFNVLLVTKKDCNINTNTRFVRTLVLCKMVLLFPRSEQAGVFLPKEINLFNVAAATMQAFEELHSDFHHLILFELLIAGASF